MMQPTKIKKFFFSFIVGFFSQFPYQQSEAHKKKGLLNLHIKHRFIKSGPGIEFPNKSEDFKPLNMNPTISVLAHLRTSQSNESGRSFRINEGNY